MLVYAYRSHSACIYGAVYVYASTLLCYLLFLYNCEHTILVYILLYTCVYSRLIKSLFILAVLVVIIIVLG